MLTPHAQRSLARAWFTLDHRIANANRVFEASQGKPTSVTTPAEDKRRIEVNTLLAEGKNPYYHEKEEDRKGSDGKSVPAHIRKVDLAARAEITEGRTPYPGVTHGLPYGRRRSTLTAEAIFDGPIEQVEVTDLPAGHLWCNFCNQAFPTHQITPGVILRTGFQPGDAKKFAYIEFTSTIKPHIDYHDVIGHTGIEIKVNACPDHVGRLFRAILPIPD